MHLKRTLRTPIAIRFDIPKIVKTYKCFVLTSMSRPGVVPLEMGIVPFSWLAVTSSQERIFKLPMEFGIGPLKLFEFRDLQRMWTKKKKFKTFKMTEFGMRQGNKDRWLMPSRRNRVISHPP